MPLALAGKRCTGTDMNNMPAELRSLSSWEYYLLFRNRIEHEDNLIMQRLSWLVASQSFLFTAYAIALNGLISVPATATGPLVRLEKLLLQLVPVVAVLTCSLIYASIIAAVKAIRALRESYRSPFVETKVLPDVMAATPIRRLGLSAPLLLPLVFTVVWLVLWMRGVG